MLISEALLFSEVGETSIIALVLGSAGVVIAALWKGVDVYLRTRSELREKDSKVKAQEDQAHIVYYVDLVDRFRKQVDNQEDELIQLREEARSMEVQAERYYGIMRRQDDIINRHSPLERVELPEPPHKKSQAMEFRARTSRHNTEMLKHESNVTTPKPDAQQGNPPPPGNNQV